MPSFNKVLLMGNLTRDPELRYTASGVPVSNLRMAVNRSYKTQAGEERQETCFINVVVLGKSALPCSEYLAKGSGVFVEGRLQSRSWESEGKKRSVIEVVANNVQFMTMKGRPAPSKGETPPMMGPMDGTPEGEVQTAGPEEAKHQEAPAMAEESAS